MTKIDVKYRYSNKTEEVVKAGYSISKQQRYQCNLCNRYFQLEYINNTSKLGVKEQIVQMAINGSGIRDTVRVLKVGINMVYPYLKKNLALKRVNHSISTTEVIISPEIDEQWSYVQNQAKQRWLWYALDKISLKVVTYTFGTRCDSTLESLLQKLENFKVTFYSTDGWRSYARLF